MRSIVPCPYDILGRASFGGLAWGSAECRRILAEDPCSAEEKESEATPFLPPSMEFPSESRRVPRRPVRVTCSGRACRGSSVCDRMNTLCNQVVTECRCTGVTGGRARQQRRARQQ